MTIPDHLLEAFDDARRARRRTALLVRHAERGPVFDLRTHEQVRLTERGHRQAAEAGRQLAAGSAMIVAHHSPVERCGETARALVAGAAEAGAGAALSGVVEELGNPFIRDRRRAFALVREHGGRFMREWFDGRFPDDVFEPRASAARVQLQTVWRAFAAPPPAGAEAGAPHEVVHVLVSHDWNLAIVREEHLGITPERAWPDFLDGVVVSLDGDELVVAAHGRTGRARVG